MSKFIPRNTYASRRSAATSEKTSKPRGGITANIRPNLKIKQAKTPKTRGGRKFKGKKNPAAQALGKLGGRKGGPARAQALTGAKKQDIAQHAANARWGNRTSYNKPAFYRTKPKAH